MKPETQIYMESTTQFHDNKIVCQMKNKNLSDDLKCVYTYMQIYLFFRLLKTLDFVGYK